MAIELIDLAIEETPAKTKVKAMKKAKRYILLEPLVDGLKTC